MVFSAMFRASLPLTLQRYDETVGSLSNAAAQPADLQEPYEGKAALVVGGTRGIGFAIADTLAGAGATVVVVGRTATDEVLAKLQKDRPRSRGGPDARAGSECALVGVAADLSTVAGCHAAVPAIAKVLHGSGKPSFSFVVCTVGVWPNVSEPFTSDGIDKVLMLDLVARHIIVTRLVSAGQLGPGCRLMNVLASGQHLPSALFPTASSVREVLEACVRSDATAALGGDGGLAAASSEGLGSPLTTASDPPREDMPPASRYRLESPVRSAVLTLLGTAIAHDAWLQQLARQHPDLTVASTFPGLLVTDLPYTILPVRPGRTREWLHALIPVLHLAMAPISDTDAQMGLNHASILASPNVAAHRAVRPVSYWAAPLLQAREAHPLAYDEELAAWVYAFVEGLAASS